VRIAVTIDACLANYPSIQRIDDGPRASSLGKIRARIGFLLISTQCGEASTNLALHGVHDSNGIPLCGHPGGLEWVSVLQSGDATPLPCIESVHNTELTEDHPSYANLDGCEELVAVDVEI